MIKISEGVSVGAWVNSYESDSSRRGHRSGMTKFFESAYPKIPKREIKTRLDELSLQYIREVKNGERNIDADISKFNTTIKNQAPATRNSRFSSISLFFKINELKVNKELWRIMTTTGKKRPRAAGISKEHIPTHEELAKIINYLPSHGKAVTLFLVSSGMRPAEPFELRLDQVVNLDQRPMRIDLEAGQTKMGNARYTFISDEAKGFLMEWLRHRDKFLEDRKNILRKLSKEDLYDGKLFTFSYQNFVSIWRTAVKNAGLYEVDPVTKRMTITPKILRKFFRTRGNGSNPEIAEFLVGHSVGDIGRINNKNNGIVRVYAKYSEVPEQVREVYIESEPNLTILGSTPELYELRTETEELRVIAQSKGDEIIEKSDLVKYMRRDIEKLQNDNKDLREFVENMNSLMIEMETQMADLIPEYGRVSFKIPRKVVVPEGEKIPEDYQTE